MKGQENIIEEQKNIVEKFSTLENKEESLLPVSGYTKFNINFITIYIYIYYIY